MYPVPESAAMAGGGRLHPRVEWSVESAITGPRPCRSTISMALESRLISHHVVICIVESFTIRIESGHARGDGLTVERIDSRGCGWPG